MGMRDREPCVACLTRYQKLLSRLLSRETSLCGKKMKVDLFFIPYTILVWIKSLNTNGKSVSIFVRRYRTIHYDHNVRERFLKLDPESAD